MTFNFTVLIQSNSYHINNIKLSDQWPISIISLKSFWWRAMTHSYWAHIQIINTLTNFCRPNKQFMQWSSTMVVGIIWKITTANQVPVAFGDHFATTSKKHHFILSSINSVPYNLCICSHTWYMCSHIWGISHVHHILQFHLWCHKWKISSLLNMTQYVYTHYILVYLSSLEWYLFLKGN